MKWQMDLIDCDCCNVWFFRFHFNLNFFVFLFFHLKKCLRHLCKYMYVKMVGFFWTLNQLNYDDPIIELKLPFRQNLSFMIDVAVLRWHYIIKCIGNLNLCYTHAHEKKYRIKPHTKSRMNIKCSLNIQCRYIRYKISVTVNAYDDVDDACIRYSSVVPTDLISISNMKQTRNEKQNTKNERSKQNNVECQLTQFEWNALIHHFWTDNWYRISHNSLHKPSPTRRHKNVLCFSLLSGYIRTAMTKGKAYIFMILILGSSEMISWIDFDLILKQFAFPISIIVSSLLINHWKWTLCGRKSKRQRMRCVSSLHSVLGTSYLMVQCTLWLSFPLICRIVPKEGS